MSRPPLATPPPAVAPEPEEPEPSRRSIVGLLVAVAVLLALVAAGVVTWLVLRDDDKAPTILTHESVAGLTLDGASTTALRDYTYRGGREGRLPIVAVYGSGVDGYALLAGEVPKDVTAETYTDTVRRRFSTIGADERVTAGGITARCVPTTTAEVGSGPVCAWTDRHVLFIAFSLPDRPVREVVEFLAAARRAATP